MTNTREATKRMRIQKIRQIFEKVKSEGLAIDKTKLINMMIVEHGISKKTAAEEIDAVMSYETV